jgi:F0F1-type ATP synthase assembly protein I
MMNTSESRRMWKLASRYLTFGMEMVFCVGLGTFGGRMLDEHYGSAPWGVLVLGGMGFLAAGRIVWRMGVALRDHPPQSS